LIATGRRGVRHKQALTAKDAKDAKEGQKQGRVQNKSNPMEMDGDLEMIPITEPAGTPKRFREQIGRFVSLLLVASGVSLLICAA
jgi:hypothetical protein